jgi:hypothetical protein
MNNNIWKIGLFNKLPGGKAECKDCKEKNFVFDSVKQIRNLMLTALEKYFSKIQNEGYNLKS